jgi:heat-inducible transcriptional repressor
MISELNERAREILRQVVEIYVETGDPVGSKTLARRMTRRLSPASIRNVMADLERAGLLFAPHTSAGRLPTEAGLRFFVDGLLELGNLTETERSDIEARCVAAGRNVEDVLTEATEMLSGLSNQTGLVMAPKKRDAPLRHVEFVRLSPDRALAILVSQDGVVENRVVEVPPDLPGAALVEATNFLSARLAGRTLDEARAAITAELEAHRAELNALTARVVEAGLATWGGDKHRETLIVRGQANLLQSINAVEELERIRELYVALETRNEVIRLLELAESGEGVQIYIGAENTLFNMSGCALIVAPYADSSQRVVGAIGVIGPSRLNYARIIPMVDYTAKVVGKLIG